MKRYVKFCNITIRNQANNIINIFEKQTPLIFPLTNLAIYTKKKKKRNLHTKRNKITPINGLLQRYDRQHRVHQNPYEI